MTILKTMTSLAINKKHLSVKQQPSSEDESVQFEFNRSRSERASSLALPHTSLLDFYDKQQEQCSSLLLLPTNVSAVVRRHSSHYYPMLEGKQESQPQQLEQQALEVSTATSGVDSMPLTLSLLAAESQLGITSPSSHFNYHNKANQLLMQELQSTPSLTLSSAVNNPSLEATYPVRQSNAAATPPPPIPKRTFRGKYVAWNGSRDSPGGLTSPTKTKGPLGGSTFVYPAHQNQMNQNNSDNCSGSGSDGCSFFSTTEGSAGLFVDLAARSLYSDGNISDDDRLSLENSVFDESLTSTPVKFASNSSNGGGCAGIGKTIGTGSGSGGSNGTGKLNHFATKSLATYTGGELSDAAKRSNRSSSSTVDSSGYGSAHSERCASTSTMQDFRSRFSSVDTQSSLDCCVPEKAADSPLAKELVFRMDVSGDYNCLNNNEVRTTTPSSGVGHASNNNMIGRLQKLPAVPQRKQSSVSGKLSITSTSQSLSNSNSNHSNSSSSTVSNSTSTSSTASAGSGMSTASTISMATKASLTAISPLTHTAPPHPQSQSQPQAGPQGQQQQKRAVPPTPPIRCQNSSEAAGARPGMRGRVSKHRPPPIVYPKMNQRQDSTLSSDSFSATSSPGYNSKNVMDAPLLQHAARINRSSGSSAPGIAMRHQDSTDSFQLASSRYGGFGMMAAPPLRTKINYRQDSTISSDSFSQSSSPGYNTKPMEAPLLPSLSVKRLCNMPTPALGLKQKLQLQPETIEELEQTAPISPLAKCASTPASLQTIVRFQNGTPNTMSLQHQVINRRKSSNPYITNGRLKFRLFQILLNAFALLAIAGGLAAYFNAYPTIKFVNKTIINTIHVEEVSSYGKNPAPGTCLPIIVKFCQGSQIPYNYTVFPNYIGHFGQLETQVDLDAYEALVDVRCYELVSLFLCTLFVPKCGTTGATVPPCKTLCTETMRRCGFFFDVFGLSLPEYLNCKLFKDFESAEDCVGLDQVRDVMIASSNPKCDGFQCDQNRCIPNDYVCDGHLDCMDQADEASCERCAKDEIYCGESSCVGKKHICDGIVDCPFGQDERNCIRLSERNGDLGKGVLEVFRIGSREWTPACVKNWDRAVSPTAVCSMLGYSSVNATSVLTQKTHRPLLASVNVSTDIWKMYAKKRSNLMQEFSNCRPNEDYPIAELTCANYECGKVRRIHNNKPSRRIIGGAKSNPGSWPFLAAILGGPEKIFYCAGVLISDQWVLTASHCIGNHTVIDLEDWTIQLGVTRRNSFTYSGQKVKVKTVIPHPQYNTAIAHDNDIALFQLATRVSFHEHLLPVCLPPPGLKQLKSEQLCTVIGWGKREDKDPKSTYEPIVNEVQVPIIKRQQCDEWLDNLTVSEGMICAGYEEGGKDACQGDSGGPLLCPYPGEKDRWFVGGIVSWGIMCAHPKLPGVYANVIKYVPWIQDQIQKYSKPTNDEKLSKFDTHPGGPDILSNIAAGPAKHKKPFSSQNRSPMDIDYYDNYEKT